MYHHTVCIDEITASFRESVVNNLFVYLLNVLSTQQDPWSYNLQFMKEIKIIIRIK